jgi:pimeloyl-ACP methyl ester carboxylesterase
VKRSGQFVNESFSRFRVFSHFLSPGHFMTIRPPSDSPCEAVCPGPGSLGCETCPAHGSRGLADVVARYWREANCGVCVTGRYRMPYFVWGNGPSLVFIHGVGDSSTSFLLPIARLSAHFRCIAYNLPSGQDGARLWRYRHEDLVADLWALLDQLGIERAYVLGSSFGATIALRALAERPDRLPRAVLQGGFAHRPLRRAERWLSWLARFLPGPTARLPKREKLLKLVHGEMFRDQPPEVWRAFIDWTGRSRLAALGHQAWWLNRLDLRPLLPTIRQPVLLVCGDRDRLAPLAHAEMMNASLPSAGMVVLEGCGHFPSYTHAEPFAEVVRQFLTPPERLACAFSAGSDGQAAGERGQSRC